MLSKFSPAISLLAVIAAYSAINTANAHASLMCLPNACAHSHTVIPGTKGGHNGSGSGGGNTGPGMGCPNLGPGAACNPNPAAPAPVIHIPTIDVVYNARDQLLLPAPDIHTSPHPRTYVHIKTGLQVGQAAYSVKKATATVPDQTVTVTATPDHVTWNMGEGTTTCRAATCSYTYQRSSANQPNGKYAISATISWIISWACQGTCDSDGGVLTDPMTMTTNAQLAVGEVQTESN